MQERAAQSWENFYPRPPRGGRPLRVEASAASIPDFYPRPPRGGRRPSFSSPRIRKRFLSTPSARRATELRRQHRLPTPNFYPRPPRGGRRRNPAPQPREAHFYPRPPRGGRPQATPSASDRLISIHALREEGDIAPRVFKPSAASISIHALREEGDCLLSLVMVDEAGFLSTPSARRATLLLNLTMSSCRNFYPRPPRGGRPFTPPCRCVHQNFYPRPPRGGRPPLPRLRVAVIKNFYPRPPRGGRHISLVCPQKTALFLSTPSARRATHIAVLPSKNCVISIHALREEGDEQHKLPKGNERHISIHALREEGDLRRADRYARREISIHALREEGDYNPPVF